VAAPFEYEALAGTLAAVYDDVLNGEPKRELPGAAVSVARHQTRN
jgi:hypothetical protein